MKDEKGNTFQTMDSSYYIYIEKSGKYTKLYIDESAEVDYILNRVNKALRKMKVEE